jgi:hypothetical protein
MSENKNATVGGAVGARVPKAKPQPKRRSKSVVSEHEHQAAAAGATVAGATFNAELLRRRGRP